MDLLLKGLNLLDMPDWLDKALDVISLWLDDIIYSAIASVYAIFSALASLDFGSVFKEAVDVFINNVFIIVGVFMLFVVAFSLLTYLLEPNKAADGAGKIVKNVVISLVMIAVVHPAFDFLYDFQKIIIEDQIMNRIVMGQMPADNEELDFDQLGNQMAYTMWMAFFTDADGKMCNTDSSDCDKVKGVVATGVHGNLPSIGDAYDQITDGDITYHKVFSFIGGGIVFLLLVSFTIDVGVRAFKLMLYEAIAPIAILSYINPSTQKSFKTWISAVVSTYIDLFIRVIAVLLSVLLISRVGGIFGEAQFSGLTGGQQTFAYLFVMIAALTFAKMIPSLIGDLFGVKLGGTSLNPLKNNAILGGAFGGIIGAGLGAAGGAITGATSRGVFGGISGAITGAASGATNGWKNGQKGDVRSGITAAGTATANVKKRGQALNASNNPTLFKNAFGHGKGLPGFIGAVGANIAGKASYQANRVTSGFNDTFGTRESARNTQNQNLLSKQKAFDEIRMKASSKAYGGLDKDSVVRQAYDNALKNNSNDIDAARKAAKDAGDAWDKAGYDAIAKAVTATKEEEKLNPKDKYVFDEYQKAINESNLNYKDDTTGQTIALKDIDLTKSPNSNGNSNAVLTGDDLKSYDKLAKDTASNAEFEYKKTYGETKQDK